MKAVQSCWLCRTRPYRSAEDFSKRVEEGAHNVKARVTFKDATRAKTLALGYRACADAVLRPKSGPSQFTG